MCLQYALNQLQIILQLHPIIAVKTDRVQLHPINSAKFNTFLQATEEKIFLDDEINSFKNYE